MPSGVNIFLTVLCSFFNFSWSPGNQSSILSNNWLSFTPNVFFEFFSIFSFILTFLPRFSLLHFTFPFQILNWFIISFNYSIVLVWFWICLCEYVCVCFSFWYLFIPFEFSDHIYYFKFLSCMSSKFLWGTLLWECCFLKKTYYYIIHFFITVVKPKHLELGRFIVSLGMGSYIYAVLSGFWLCVQYPNLSWFRPPE